jgi:hypothetical protein
LTVPEKHMHKTIHPAISIHQRVLVRLLAVRRVSRTTAMLSFPNHMNSIVIKRDILVIWSETYKEVHK